VILLSGKVRFDLLSKLANTQQYDKMRFDASAEEGILSGLLFNRDV
jgi:hypothetical protein